ncbi:DNA-binding transcriptional regulator, AcrR family [Microbacterium azadirachtae]|uniref:DNA-binding transcriptional regulator, AcrR family n=1 Tax=Microbacterium azadirachtae TaxID=582680 RepID=A0A1I6I832_9MICO|nr:TetR/AcrR family transcriptional regulator [Microbacterium azadirachtae]SFR62540.1 DNA-binding transcriptional regulator, AcrR family [Microbacterium azadirachtae]
MARRGSYAKGIAKREEILRTALAVIAREGYHGASVKELAEAVGLSQAGLLHYFDSKDELFVEILRTRDEIDLADHAEAAGADLDDLRDGYLDIVRHNAQVPGLVELFTRLAADAADPEHPSRAFFAERSAGLRDRWAATIAEAQAAGRLRAGIDPVLAARLLQAVSDGAQMQLLVEPELDMAALIETLFDLLQAPAQRAAASSGRTEA